MSSAAAQKITVHPTGEIDQNVFTAAFAALAEHHRPVLITGRAGTGKTTLIRELSKDKGIKQVVIAPTGVAALQAGGQTIHSFFQIPPRLHNLHEMQPVRGKNKQVIKHLQRLIIDEISMVRADLIDKIDHALKINRMNDRPFGGVQLVMIGDFYQLPPVVQNSEAALLQAAGYTTPYAPGAKALREANLQTVELQQVFRQRDPEFINLLGNIRGGQDLPGTLEHLNRICVCPHRAGYTPLLLTGRNAEADAYNHAMLAALPSDVKIYKGETGGEFGLDGDQLPAPQQLQLKINARVMLLKNDPQKRFVNGSLATITKLANSEITVRLDNGETYKIEPHNWERYRYSWNAAKEEITSEVVGTYNQLPVKLAWASTVHKAQGLSLEDVRIDMQRGAFASGQVYVALSRATSLHGLSLTHPLKPSDIIVDRQIAQMLTAI